MFAELLDRIYECSVVPELWPAVLDDLARLTGSSGGLLFSVRSALHWTASDRVRDVFDEYVRDGWFTRCRRRVCLAGQEAPSFFVEQDFWTAEELDREPIYRDFFRPRGLGWSAGTCVQVPTGDNIIFSVERAYERGPIEAAQVDLLNTLRPHLARSGFVTARMKLERAQGAVETLAALRLPALLIDTQGRALGNNALAEEVSPYVHLGANDRVILADNQAQEMFQTALEGFDRGSAAAAKSIPIRDSEGSPALIAHLLPVRRTARDLFSGSFALLVLMPTKAERAPPETLLKSLFDLTPSEARIAAGLARGRTLTQIAEEGHVALTTVRSQLRAVLEKTGCTRQAEVAALLASIAAHTPGS